MRSCSRARGSRSWAGRRARTIYRSRRTHVVPPLHNHSRFDLSRKMSPARPDAGWVVAVDGSILIWALPPEKRPPRPSGDDPSTPTVLLEPRTPCPVSLIPATPALVLLRPETA